MFVGNISFEEELREIGS